MIIAVANTKGGSGKTTTCVNLAHALALSGNRTLVVDLDAQGHSSVHLRAKDPTKIELLAESSASVLVEIAARGASIDPAVIHAAIRQSPYPLLHILPGDACLERVEEAYLRSFVDPLEPVRYLVEPLRQDYDAIILDCPPHLSRTAICTLSAIYTADGLLVPCRASGQDIESVVEFFRRMDQIRAQRRAPIPILGILVSYYMPGEAHSRDAIGYLKAEYPTLLLDTMIPKGTSLAASFVARRTILDYRPHSPLTATYRALAREVSKRAARLEPVHAS